RHVERGMRWTPQRYARRSARETMTLRWTAKACGPGLPTLRSSKQSDLLATGARKPGPRGELAISVKTIAQGMPDDLAEPVVTAASFSCCWRAMGEAFTRHSLRPLHLGGGRDAQLGHIVPRER